MDFLITTGRYVLFLKSVFSRFESRHIYVSKTIIEINQLGMSSIGFVSFISLFVGAVVTLQVAYNMENPLLPTYLIGLSSRDSLILEFSPTMISLVLAGKIGSHIASSLGTMIVTEQIDALEVMGVNEFGFSFAVPFESYAVGLTVKYLQGLFYMGLDPDSSKADFITTPKAVYGSGTYYLRQGFGGSGYGIDIGLVTKEFNRLRFGASIINASASIGWNKPSLLKAALKE